MPYGTLKVDNIIFTNGGVDQTITVSGIVASTSGNLTATGTISGNIIRGGTTVSGATVTGSAGQFGNLTAVSGTFTTQLSGVTVTGTTANFTSGNFNNISGGTHTITSGVFAAGTATNPSISFTSDPNTGIYRPAADEIGFTTNGQVKLVIDVDGQLEANAIGSESIPTYTFSSDSDTGIYSPGANQLAISTNGTGRLFVDSSGRVGVATTPSAWSWNAIQLGAYAGFFATNSAAYASYLGNNAFYDGSSWKYIGSTGAVHYELAAGDIAHKWYTAASGTAGNSITWSERMRLDSSGQLGLGTSSPDTRLHVNSSFSGYGGTEITADTCLAAFTGGAEKTIRVVGGTYQSGTSTANLHLTNAGANNYNAGNTGYRIQANYNGSSQTGYFSIDSSSYSGTAYTYSPVFLIDGAGRVGLGTTSPSYALDIVAADPTAGIGYAVRLRANSTAGAAAIQFTNASGLTQAFAIAADTSNNLKFLSDSNVERARIDSSGRLLVGTSTSTNNIRLDQKLAVVGNSASGSTGAAFINYSNTPSHAGLIDLSKSRGTTDGSMTIVQSGDNLGYLVFRGANGTAFVDSAYITAVVEGTPSSAKVPSRLAFHTVSDATGFADERMRIDNAGYLVLFNRPFQAYNTGGSYDMGGTGPGVEVFAGLEVGRWHYHMGSLVSAGAIGPIFRYTQNSNWASPTTICTLHTTIGSSFNSVIKPGVDNTYACGESGARWSAIWAANGTIQTSDVRDKTDIEPVSHGIEFIRKLNPVTYKWKIGSNQVIKDKDGGPIPDKNGNPQTVAVPGQRTHWGFAAQEVKEVVDELGLDFGGWVLTDVDNPDSQQALRYDQFIAPLTKALQEAIAKIETLEAKVATLEAV